MKDNDTAQGSFAIVEERREDPLALTPRQSKTLSKLFGNSMWRPGAKVNSTHELSNEFRSTLLLNFQASSTLVP
jgi:hypothetical protein